MTDSTEELMKSFEVINSVVMRHGQYDAARILTLSLATLEQLGYTFAGEDWMQPANDAAALAPTITDELHAMLVKRADDPTGKVAGGKG